MKKTKLLLLLFLPLTLWAQESTTTVTKMIGVGSVNLLDTYLSSEEYTGTEARYMAQSVRQSIKHKPLSYIMVNQGNVSVSHNRADNNDELAGGYNFLYAVHYNWLLADNRVKLHAGGGADAALGFIYNTRNSNNPAQAKALLALAPSAGATYSFTVKNHPFNLNYDIEFPLTGVMFSPNYGQSYYEIFNRGNYDHNCVVTTIFSTPSLRSMISLDFTVAHTKVRVGYLGDFQQSKVNALKYHSWSNLLVVGITTQYKHEKVKK